MKAPVFAQKRYLLIKATATFLALVFAFAYSRELGVVNRSILAYVFTLSSLIWIFLTSGTTLTLRKNQPDVFSRTFASFQTLLLVQLLIGLIVFSLGLFLFSTFKTSIPGPLLFASYLYFVSSGVAMLLVETSIAYFDFKISGYLELVAVVIQILLYFIVLTPVDLTIAIQLILSFIASYISISLIFLRRFRKQLGASINFASPHLFFKLTKGNHSLGISLGVMDRLDRLIIAFAFPTGILAKYSVMSSLISYFRFVPEFISRVLIARNDSIYLELRKHRKILFLGILLVGSLMIFSAQSLIRTFLGSSWALSIGIVIAFVIQELVRGTYQLTLNIIIKRGDIESAKYIPWIAIIAVLPLAVLAVKLFGLIGVPLSFTAVFLLASFFGYRWRNNV
jgi:O-antigen/teichoic acid export membrane protein